MTGHLEAQVTLFVVAAEWSHDADNYDTILQQSESGPMSKWIRFQVIVNIAVILLK